MHCSWQRLARRFIPPALGAILALAGCGREADRATGASPAAARTPTAAEAEAEEIRQLLAYAIVGAGWDTEARVGHNIAAVLVTPDGMPVWWERNANFAQHSSIEHAEARLLTSYIGGRRELGRPVPRLAGYSVYSTVEPCAMCVGMMIVAEVDRVMYGQRDPRWGRAAERLSIDSRALGLGFTPYPRGVLSEPSRSPFRERLEDGYRSHEGAITEWLDTAQAEEIFMDAVRALQHFAPKHAPNQAVVDAARAQYQLALENRHR